MKTLEQQMAFYAAYHGNRGNRLMHFIGVPAIIFSILIPMGRARVSWGSIEITLAMAFVLGVIIYYIALDTLLALTMGALIVPLL